MEIIGVIVAGIIIGLLGKFVAPSSQTTSRSGSPSCAASLVSLSAGICTRRSVETAAQGLIGCAGSLRLRLPRSWLRSHPQ